MKTEFYPSKLTRIAYALLAYILVFIFFKFTLEIFPIYGEDYAADGFNLTETFTFCVGWVLCLLLGFRATHIAQIALSPWPSLIINEEGLTYHQIGYVEGIKIRWNEINSLKIKGMNLSIWIKKTNDINEKKNIFYKFAQNFIAKYFFSTKLFKKEYTPNKIDIFRLNVGMPLKDIKDIIDLRIQKHASRTTALDTFRYSSTGLIITRNKPFNFAKVISKTIPTTAIYITVLLPALSFTYGILDFKESFENDLAVRKTQSLRHLALKGDADAQNKMGWHLSNGVGINESDKRAFIWFLRSAKQGFPKAQYNVGSAYKKGRGVKKNYKKAFHWYQKAAQSDLYLAKQGLAYFYYKGLGTQTSYVKALKLFREAAEESNGYSYYYLGLMYERGHAPEKSITKAIEYYQKSSEQGYSYAEKAIKRLEN